MMPKSWSKIYGWPALQSDLIFAKVFEFEANVPVTQSDRQASLWIHTKMDILGLVWYMPNDRDWIVFSSRRIDTNI